MGKLLFEDKDGSQHEINLQKISSKSIKAGDTVIAYYEVGDAPSKQVEVVMGQLKRILQGVMPEGVEVVVIATRFGKKDITLEVVKDKTGE